MSLSIPRTLSKSHFHLKSHCKSHFLCKSTLSHTRYFATNTQGPRTSRNIANPHAGGINPTVKDPTKESTTFTKDPGAASPPRPEIDLDEKFSDERFQEMMKNNQFGFTNTVEMVKIMKEYKEKSAKAAEAEGEAPLDMESIMDELRASGALKKDRTKLLRALLYCAVLLIGILFVQGFSLANHIRTMEKEMEVQRRLVGLKWKKKLEGVVGKETLAKGTGPLVAVESGDTAAVAAVPVTSAPKKMTRI